MIMPCMILEAQKRLKRITRAKPYKYAMRQYGQERRRFVRAALMAKLLNDIYDEWSA